MDGKLLARARQEKDRIYHNSRQEDRRRHDVAYARVPALRTLDQQIAALAAQAADAALGHGPSIAQLQRESLELQAQRADLLAANGWPIDWLDGAWDCPECRDSGYVHGRMCACLKKLYDQAQTADLSALLKLGSESFSTFNLSLYESKPDPVTGVSPRQQMEYVYGICYDYARNFQGMHKGNLLFRGGTGLGKTFLSACIAREVAKQGFSVVYETAVAALDAFEQQHFSREGENAEAADALVRRMLDCDLLIMDDLGTEFVTEFTKSALYTLVNTRLNNHKRTIISTNLPPHEMTRRYTPQIMSRLEGEYQVLPFVGSDIRILKKELELD